MKFIEVTMQLFCKFFNVESFPDSSPPPLSIIIL